MLMWPLAAYIGGASYRSPLFNLIDSFETVMGLSLVFTIYILLTVASLILDRRALMVAALGYALYAASTLFAMLAMMIRPMRWRLLP